MTTSYLVGGIGIGFALFVIGVFTYFFWTRLFKKPFHYLLKGKLINQAVKELQVNPTNAELIRTTFDAKFDINKSDERVEKIFINNPTFKKMKLYDINLALEKYENITTKGVKQNGRRKDRNRKSKLPTIPKVSGTAEDGADATGQVETTAGTGTGSIAPTGRTFERDAEPCIVQDRTIENFGSTEPNPKRKSKYFG